MNAFMNKDAETLHGIIKQDNLVLIDVRNDDEVARGIIQGAKHIPLANLPQAFDKLPKKSSIVFYFHNGIPSAHAASYLTEDDYRDVNHLAGGIIAWANAGYTFSALK